jgi:formylglycine-generating enzyme required for sulfatase activity
MNVKPILCFFGALTISLAGVNAQNTPAKPAATNAPPPTSQVTTNQPALTNSEPKVAEAPGDLYTNCVDMVLTKVPGGFWAGKYEVTQKEYQEVMGANPSEFSGDKQPVDNLSWNDAMEFCEKLTAKDIAATNLPVGYRYTLPTESQWESLVGDASLSDAVSSQNGPRAGTAEVGSLGANSLGLYDTRGNVMEWTLGDDSKPYRVLRGGSWQDNIEINLRIAFRFYSPPGDHKNTYGFRCVLMPPADK